MNALKLRVSALIEVMSNQAMSPGSAAASVRVPSKESGALSPVVLSSVRTRDL